MSQSASQPLVTQRVDDVATKDCNGLLVVPYAYARNLECAFHHAQASEMNLFETIDRFRKNENPINSVLRRHAKDVELENISLREQIDEMGKALVAVREWAASEDGKCNAAVVDRINAVLQPNQCSSGKTVV